MKETTTEVINTKAYFLNSLNTIWTDVDRGSLTMYKYTCPRSRCCWYGPVGAGWRSFLPPHSAACWWRLPASCGPGDHRRLCSTIGTAVPCQSMVALGWPPIKHGICVYHKNNFDKQSMRKNHMGGAQVQFLKKLSNGHQ